jgi:polysaccharide export outer membrane protein
MTKKIYLNIILIAMAFYSVSCGNSNKIKSMIYLSDSTKEAQKIVTDYQHTLQTGDRIQILVTALNVQAAQVYNLSPIVSSLNTGNFETSPANNIASNGYLVEQDGSIQFPQLGKIAVQGMTTTEVGKKIQEKLLQFLKEPVVIVNISNFRINVLGEVNHPGTITVSNGKISILEAISQSGDLTIFGKRENIMVIREKNGKREFGQINLTSKSLFQSPYYYLEQGDVVYVEMNKDKLILNDANEAKNFRIYSLVLGAISALGIILSALRN